MKKMLLFIVILITIIIKTPIFFISALVGYFCSSIITGFNAGYDFVSKILKKYGE